MIKTKLCKTSKSYSKNKKTCKHVKRSNIRGGGGDMGRGGKTGQVHVANGPPRRRFFGLFGPSKKALTKYAKEQEEAVLQLNLLKEQHKKNNENYFLKVKGLDLAHRHTDLYPNNFLDGTVFDEHATANPYMGGGIERISYNGHLPYKTYLTQLYMLQPKDIRAKLDLLILNNNKIKANPSLLGNYLDVEQIHTFLYQEKLKAQEQEQEQAQDQTQEQQKNETLLSKLEAIKKAQLDSYHKTHTLVTKNVEATLRVNDLDPDKFLSRKVLDAPATATLHMNSPGDIRYRSSLYNGALPYRDYLTNLYIAQPPAMRDKLNIKIFKVEEELLDKYLDIERIAKAMNEESNKDKTHNNLMKTILAKMSKREMLPLIPE